MLSGRAAVHPAEFVAGGYQQQGYVQQPQQDTTPRVESRAPTVDSRAEVEDRADHRHHRRRRVVIRSLALHLGVTKDDSSPTTRSASPSAPTSAAPTSTFPSADPACRPRGSRPAPTQFRPPVGGTKPSPAPTQGTVLPGSATTRNMAEAGGRTQFLTVKQDGELDRRGRCGMPLQPPIYISTGRLTAHFLTARWAPTSRALPFTISGTTGSYEAHVLGTATKPYNRQSRDDHPPRVVSFGKFTQHSPGGRTPFQ